ncbi:MAG: hypothetical protein DIU63_14630, partial [Proteobacteria bacterium]
GPVFGAVGGGLARGPLMRHGGPAFLEILGADAGLPPLPDFCVNLYLPESASDIARELARHIRQCFEQRFGPVPQAPQRRVASDLPATKSGRKSRLPVAAE